MNKFKKALPFVLIVLFVASVGIFIINRGLKYSDYENYIKVDVRGEKDVDTFLERLNNSSGLIEIDRNNKTAYYQHIEQAIVEENVSTLKTEYPEIVTNVQKVLPAVSKKEKALNIASIGLALIVLFMGYSYVVKTRFYNWTRNDYLKYYGFYLLDNTLAVGILVGLISLLSLVYKINDYILYSVFFLILFKTLIFWFKLLQENIDEMKFAYVENFKNDYKKLFTIAFILIVLITVGMGVKSVIPLTLLLAAIIISALSDYSILTFEIPRLNKQTFGSEEIKAKNKKEVIQPEVIRKYIPDPKLKKKNKKK